MAGTGDFSIISLNANNIDSEHICCALSDKKCELGVNLKKEWLKQRMAEGLVFKKLDVRGKVFIEYLPAEVAWYPVDAPGYMFINCLWVSGSFKGKGYGAKLLDECFRDAGDKNGVVILSSKKKKPFLSDKKYLTGKGFEVCDTAPPDFELLVKRFKDDAPSPRFRESAKELRVDNREGLTVIYSDQCPFTDYYVNQELVRMANHYHISIKVEKISSRKQAQDAPMAFTIHSVFYKGEFLTHQILIEKNFRNILHL